MTEFQAHKGVRFSIVSLDAGYWRWEIFPPADVQGLYTIAGEVIGHRSEAIAAAKRMIDFQDHSLRSDA